MSKAAQAITSGFQRHAERKEKGGPQANRSWPPADYVDEWTEHPRTQVFGYS
jgi:hypothetical protein